MPGTRYYTANPFEVDQNGVPLAAARLFFYETGTVTLLDTWSDVGLTTPNANPVVADGNGRFGAIWLSPTEAYNVELWTKVTAEDPDGSQIWAEDPVGPASGGAQQSIAGIVGEIRAYAGLASAIPGGWALCHGQAVSRTSFAVAFAAMGTSWGEGDGSTTFNLPDMRGRLLAGIDNMGGVAANRITSGVAGIAGNTLGAVGGDQAAQEHTHTINDPEHTHTVADHHHVMTGSMINGTGGTTSGSHFIAAGSGIPIEDGALTADATLTIASAATGVTADTAFAGAAQNVQPTAMVNMIIYLGA